MLIGPGRQATLDRFQASLQAENARFEASVLQIRNKATHEFDEIWSQTQAHIHQSDAFFHASHGVILLFLQKTKNKIDHELSQHADLFIIDKILEGLDNPRQFSLEHVSEQLNDGAFVRAPAELYDHLSQHPLKYFRGNTHSHKTNSPAICIDSKFFPGACYLIGRYNDSEGNPYTWIQCEASKVTLAPTHYDPYTIIQWLYHIVCHLLDYMKYKLSGKNIGPGGKSVHTETKDPIDLRTLCPGNKRKYVDSAEVDSAENKRLDHQDAGWTRGSYRHFFRSRSQCDAPLAALENGEQTACGPEATPPARHTPGTPGNGATS